MTSIRERDLANAINDIRGFSVDPSLFDSVGGIENRVAAIPAPDKRLVSRALRFIYCENAPTNFDRSDRSSVREYLTIGEQIALTLAVNKVTGPGRSSFGAKALIELRKSRFSCRICGFADVRALDVDHVHGRDFEEFRVVCGNCHRIKTWTDRFAAH